MVVLGEGAVPYARGTPVRPTVGNAVCINTPFSVDYPTKLGRFLGCHGSLCPVQGYLTYERTPPLGPYRRPMPWALEGSWGVGVFLMGEIPL